MQYAIENGIIDLQRVQQQIEMNKRSIIGNLAEVNDNHYTYDICDMTTKNQLVTDIEKKMLTNCSFGSSIRMPLTTEELCYNRYSNCNIEPVGKQEKRRRFI